MKPCQAPNCNNNAQSHGYCFRHGYLRTDDKYIRSKEKQRQKVLNARQKKPRNISFGFDNQLSMFRHLWRERKLVQGNVICEFTGEKLDKYYGTSLWINCFLHILNKKNYPYWKLNPENIIIASPEFHKIMDQGTYKDREAHPEWNWESWDELVLAMKDEYLHFKKENLLP